MNQKRKINLEKYFPYDNKRIVWGVILSVIAGSVFIYQWLTNQPPTNSVDLMNISGVLTDYRFRDIPKKESKSGYPGQDYKLTLNEYRTIFRIPPEFISHLHKYSFEKDIQRGDSIEVAVSRYDASRINSENEIIIYSIRKNKFEYLIESRCLQEANSNTGLVGGIILYLFAGFGLYLRYENIIRKKYIKY